MTTNILTGKATFRSLSLSGESWLQAKGAPSNYFVSDMGRILTTSYKGGYGTRVMKPSPNPGGYLTTVVGGKARTVHRLIAETFIPNPEKKETVNHKNGIKTDNRVENLEWMTRSEQLQHAWDTGLQKAGISRGSNFRKLTEGQARELLRFRLENPTMPIRMMAAYLSAKTGFHFDGIRDLLAGRTWKFLQAQYPYERQGVWQARNSGSRLRGYMDRLMSGL